MKVRLAKRTGFCFGVKRAVSMAERAIKQNPAISSLGSIIHNAEVVNDLSKKGLKAVRDVSGIKSGAVVISSHGISPRTAAAIKRRGVRIIDTTCPFVLKAQETARKINSSGDDVIIAGDRSHPEVKALAGFLDNRARVVSSAREAGALRFRRSGRVSVISQTTQSTANFLDIVRAIRLNHPGKVRVFNTICRDAEERQTLARRLAGEVDVMLIVGGRDSANTRRLYEVCKKILKDSYLIETERDINCNWFGKNDVVGIASGASTPDWLIKRVVEKIKKI